MIEVNFTLIIQAINFLVLLWFLNRFIFRPILSHIDEREQKFKDLTDEADRFARRGEESKARYEKDIVEIRHSAAEIVAAARKEAQENSARILEDSKAKFKGIIETSRTQIKNEVDVASGSLNKELKEFGQSMAEKILGRSMSS